MHCCHIRHVLAFFLFAWPYTARAWLPSSSRRWHNSWPLELATKRTEEQHGVQFSTRRNVQHVPLDDDAVPLLQRQLLAQNKEDNILEAEQNSVQIAGYLISKRGFGPSFCFMDISRRGVEMPVQAILKRQAFGNAKHFDGFMKSLVPGIRISVVGPVEPTRNPGEVVILVQHMRIHRLPHNPQHVRKLIKLVSDGFLEASHIVPATKLTENELLQGIQKAKDSMDLGHPKLFNDLTLRILEGLKDEHENDSEYPDFNSGHKYTNSLPVPPVELQPPALLSEEIQKGIILEQQPELLSIETIMERYFHKPNGHSDTVFEAICLTGCVQNRRRFRGSITTLEIVDEMVPLRDDSANPQEDPGQQRQPDRKQRLKCILHPDLLEGSNTTHAAILGQLLAPGSQVRLKGYILPNNCTSNGVASLWIHQIDLLRSSWRPNVVQYLIEELVQHRFQIPEAARALQLSQRDLARIISLKDLTQRQWESAEIARRLQRESVDLSSHVDPTSLSVLDDFKELRASRPLKFVDVGASTFTRNDFVSTEGSRWKRKKEPQLEWMTQRVERVLQTSGKFDDGKTTLRVLDVGGGKGFLANYLAQRLMERGYRVKLLVVDVDEGAIHNGRLRTKRCNLSEVVEYKKADASTVDLHRHGGVDLVVALHACGALTDVALGHAVDHQAAFVICPCCFRSNPQLCVPVRRQGATTYSVPVEEWLDVEDSQYDKLKGLAEVQEDINLANRAIHTLCALRSSSVERHSIAPMKVSIQTFPVAFSTRNFCLVGERR